jgi:hypothetical protein
MPVLTDKKRTWEFWVRCSIVFTMIGKKKQNENENDQKCDQSVRALETL